MMSTSPGDNSVQLLWHASQALQDMKKPSQRQDCPMKIGSRCLEIPNGTTHPLHCCALHESILYWSGTAGNDR